MKYPIFTLIFLLSFSVFAQTDVDVVINTNEKYQTVEGFGAALAYYENWLTAHPNKAEIYDVIFSELSLDILRVRNAYDYDTTMIDRIAEFNNAAKNSLGHHIKILATSWGPPAYLKSNNNRNNGGSLKYTVNGSTVEFNYAGFADWWNKSLDEYNASGVYPAYISLQNEPDYKASWESCLFKPTETINSADTIAGYNQALEAVYNKIEQRDVKPKILGPETIGIGYNTVQNYINALNSSYIYGVAHHLYHGVDENNPWVSSYFNEVGNLQEELPHFQTEYSRGDWFSLGGLMFKSFNDENVVAYLYWDLIWDGSGLVNIEFPWDKNRWTTENGYIKTKEFYAFKQYSAFIHPDWTRINCSNEDENIKTLAFINPALDSVSLVLVNRSETENINVSISIDDFSFHKTAVYRTSENENCLAVNASDNSNLTLPKKSITTLQLTTGGETAAPDICDSSNELVIYPNPVSEYVTIQFPANNTAYDVVAIFDGSGQLVEKQKINNSDNPTHNITIDCRGFRTGFYYFRIESTNGERLSGKFIVQGD
ncbi:T9SS type A sorting domain-containing protein [Draconibacterium sp. IB214405]|uniref:T9SS type A sorting domain-containing protein n=1 Tax=Draconibacterium sp. IB214405 TaxID=3097352 RepID=UPI002A13A37B|nr:T9SS type A sorting domain-containing protein [Draconibacterium sp. IB214405]MDX8337925.1 T9SS type A sorting domain-containing protein [Draconibacterium sp. IB214405]